MQLQIQMEIEQNEKERQIQKEGKAEQTILNQQVPLYLYTI